MLRCHRRKTAQGSGGRGCVGEFAGKSPAGVVMEITGRCASLGLPCKKTRKIEHQKEKGKLLPPSVSPPCSPMSSPNIALADKREALQGLSPGTPSRAKKSVFGTETLVSGIVSNRQYGKYRFRECPQFTKVICNVKFAITDKRILGLTSKIG